MFNATLKRILFLLTLATVLSLAGCSNPEEKKAKQLTDARELTDQGAYKEALMLLEAIALEYPNDLDVLKLQGKNYALQGDHTSAAFFLSEAQTKYPENVELLYETYQSLFDADQPSGAMLEKLAALSETSMTKELWLRLGEYRAAQNQNESALNAYLNGVDPDKVKPSAETAAAIGQLFADLGNNAQAAEWFAIAADNDSPSALTALFGLLQIQLSDKQLPAAEATIARLDKQFPGAVEASQWKQQSEELKRWREAQEKMKAKLAAAEAAQKAAEQAAKEAAEQAIEAAEATGETAKEATETAEATEGKAQVIADLEMAEALANKPAEEISLPTFDPNILIQPAEPDLSIAVSFDEQATAAETDISVIAPGNVTAIETSEPIEAAALVETAGNSQIANTPREGPKTLETWLTEAEDAEIERNYKSAIRKYWSAISIDNKRADIWNLLSRAYLVDGQLPNADTAALEAVRLSPREVAYTLDFLRIAQRSRPSKEFLGQLETAYDRFPASPEITLSLARGHEQISKDNFVARNLYLRFIDIAPNHPLVPEAKSAAARLR
jgi:Flp pilus assembly protein TadD